jgi:hypothetical protein
MHFSRWYAVCRALALADAGTAAWHEPAFWRGWNGIGWEVPAWR